MKLLNIPYSHKAIFLDRPNRFLGVVRMNKGEGEEEVHIHDPGRLKELLYRGNEVLIRTAKGKNRRTRWDMLAARKKKEWIFIHSGYHSKIAHRLFELSLIKALNRVEDIRPEVKVPDGRLDFQVKMDGISIWIETKGCTLIDRGIAFFPDAPTKRGRKHLQSLMELKAKGERAALLILIFSKNVLCFSPNKDTDPLFAEAFFSAIERGVEVYPVSLSYNGTDIYFYREIPLCRR